MRNVLSMNNDYTSVVFSCFETLQIFNSGSIHKEVVNKFLHSDTNSRNMPIESHCAATKIGITFEPKVTS